MKNPLVLIIMDGFGIAKDCEKSAIAPKTAPNLKKIFEKYPTTRLKASGAEVGLPDGQMGNSEVGHTNIGAGRVVYQDLTRITNSIINGSFYKNTVLKNAILSTKKNNSALHLMGLLSDGGVHSHIDHLFALLEMAKNYALSKVYVHAFLDGRDVAPTSGIDFVNACQNEMARLNIGEIATIMGRFFAMDRDNRWERVKKAYNAVVNSNGIFNESPAKALENVYAQGFTDEFIEPIICKKEATLNSGDSVIFFNFRPDRARQLTHAIVDKRFDAFYREKSLDDLNFVCLTEYDKKIEGVKVAFCPQKIEKNFAEVISENNLTQLRISETEKYAHVTFFFNGGVEQKYVGEDRILIPSPKVETYDLQPEMSAYEITKIVKEKIATHSHDVIILNFANCDMVGHTGNFKAAQIAVQTVDKCVTEVVNATQNAGGCVIVTADHGNAEKMLDENGKIFTAHTTNSVPFCVVGHKCELKPTGKLADIAPTILEMLNLPKPTEMTSESLIVKD